MVDEETGKHVNCPFEKKEAMYNEMLSRFDKQLEKFDVKFEELNSFKNRVIRFGYGYVSSNPYPNPKNPIFQVKKN